MCQSLAFLVCGLSVLNWVIILCFLESSLLLMIMLLSDILVLELVPWLCWVGVLWVLSSHLSFVKHFHLWVCCMGVKYLFCLTDLASINISSKHLVPSAPIGTAPLLLVYCICVTCCALSACLFLSLWWCRTIHCDQWCLPFQLHCASMAHHPCAAQLL